MLGDMVSLARHKIDFGRKGQTCILLSVMVVDSHGVQLKLTNHPLKKTLEKCYVVEAHSELKIAIYIIVSI